MATNRWIGDAAGVAQQTKVTPAIPEIGDKFRITCNRKTVEIIATGNTVEDVVNQLVLALLAAAEEIPEFDEFTASAGVDDAGNVTHVLLTGGTDGKPFTVTGSTVNVATFDVAVTEAQKGSASRNQKQRIRLPGPPTAGNFTLTLSGATTGNIAFNANAGTVQTAIQGLATVGASNATVTENSTGDWTVEFVAGLALTTQALFTGTNVSLTGACSLAITTGRQGRPANYAKGETYTLAVDSEVERFRFSFVPGASGFTGFEYFSNYVIVGDTGATPDDIRKALESILVPVILSSEDATSDQQSGTVPVYTLVDVTGPTGGPYTIVIREGLTAAMINADMLQVDDVEPDDGDVTLTLQSAASTTAINELHYFALIGGPTGGTYTLTFQGLTTAGINWNDNAAAVQAALEALANIAPGDVVVTGSGTVANPFALAWGGVYAGVNVQAITGSATGLTGATPTAEIIQDAELGVNEQQQLQINTDGTPTGGTFTLTLNGETTGGINYNADAATIQTSIIALATPAAGDISVTGGPFPSMPVIVEFKGQYAASDVAAMSGSGASLTGSNTQTLTVSANTVDPTGPYHADNANNWSLTHTPAAAEDIIITGDRSIKYGLTALAAIVPGSIVIEAAFTGDIGLEYQNEDYLEYRQRKLQIGGAGTFKVFIGRGEGTGSKLIALDLQTAVATVIVQRSATPDVERPAVLLLFGSASADLSVMRGSVGIAFDAAETSTIGTIRESFLETKDSDSFVVVGAGVTASSILKHAGSMQIFCAITAMTQDSGVTDFEGTGACSSLSVFGGIFNYNSTGALGGAPIVAGDGILNFDGDGRAKTVTNPIDVYGDEANVKDSFKVVTTLIIDYNFTTRQEDLGFNYRITRAVTA